MQDLTQLQARLRQQRPVVWEQLPDFALYMDQVLSYMDRQVIGFDDGDILTAAMVNNYTKSGLVPRAKGKKYDREHLAYLTAICILKRVMSTRDMDLLIKQALTEQPDVSQCYTAFCGSLGSALDRTADEISALNGEGSLSDAAIHFALLSYAAGVASNRCVAQLRAQTEPDGGASEKKSRKERD